MPHIEGQKLEHAERRLCRLRRKHERDIARHICNQTRSLLKHLVETPHAPAIPIVNL